MNSKTSPGNTSSGRYRHVRTTRNVVMVAAVMNRDAVKHIGARNTFIVSSATCKKKLYDVRQVQLGQ